jgi:hypothetical protein
MTTKEQARANARTTADPYGMTTKKANRRQPKAASFEITGRSEFWERGKKFRLRQDSLGG